MPPVATKILNQQGVAVGELAWPAGLTKLVIKPVVVHQVAMAYAANRRQGTAHTKDRSEVAGGGKKPWKQKGTGRARHGSIRSPLWVGGGVTFGPRKERNYSQRLPEKLKQQATAMVIKDYLVDNRLTVVEAWPAGTKTKVLAEFFKTLKLTSAKPYLVLLTDEEKTLSRGLRNLANVVLMGVKQFNLYDGLRHRHWVLSQAAARQLLIKVK
ncbi:MAG: 50S ribosomal protein L4 [Candidatus Kerfeldbacteria bacterium]|nr:50S ribosomal protein L4 [Candidatus Kerfeldbacteria bacterium]